MRRPAPRVRLWEDSMVIPTSEEGLPDPNPPFDLFNTGRFHNYPYTLRHNLVDHRVPRKWRTLNLERSEEHTSELQSLTNLVCRLLLEKKNTLKKACKVRSSSSP